MKNINIIIFLFLSRLVTAQSEVSPWEIGAFYTFILNRDLEVAPGEIGNLNEHYINIHTKYNIGHNFKIPFEGIAGVFKLSNGLTIDNPFYIVGTGLEYDVIPKNKINLNFRLGLSVGNLLFSGDQVTPSKRWVMNRVIGGNFEFQAFKVFWISFGYYNHFPLVRKQYKHGFALPFLGVKVKI